jgi:hypothetical protein
MGSVVLFIVVVVTTLLTAMPLSAACPAVPVKLIKSPLVELVGPVVMPAPLPARAFEDVIVVAVAAMGTWVAVMPDMPLDVST